MEKEGKKIKSAVKELWPGIISELDELGVDAVEINGKKLSVTETQNHGFEQSDKQAIIQWCIDNDRLEFLDIPTRSFPSACKAEIECAEEQGREPVLPPGVTIKTFSKVNGL
jgi:hypothetical protein